MNWKLYAALMQSVWNANIVLIWIPPCTSMDTVQGRCRESFVTFTEKRNIGNFKQYSEILIHRN